MGKHIKHNYKNLEIWKRAIDIADIVYLRIESFPANEKYGLMSQMSRSSISLSSNIAEGSARTEKSFVHFLSISLGSSFELETQLIIANRRGYLNQNHFRELMSFLDEFQKMTIGFQRKLIARI